MSMLDFHLKKYFADNIPRPLAAYDANGNLEYQGWARQGVATSAAVWVICKHSYDASNRWTGSQTVVNSVWDDRSTYF